jgi:hypothetical protein
MGNRNERWGVDGMQQLRGGYLLAAGPSGSPTYDAVASGFQE